MIAAIMRIYKIAILALVVPTGFCFAQTGSSTFPEKLVIAQHSFIDVGPPNDFYELIQIEPSADGVAVERTLITPEGQACIQPATVETRLVTLHQTFPAFLEGKNPCAIPEKELHKEVKRCKKCLVFSGINVKMQATCGGKQREIRMEILDRDMFDAHANTPEETSWTMRVLGEIDKATGPGGWDKPIFPTGDQAPIAPKPETETVRELREGKYDRLFGLSQLVSQVVSESEQPPPPAPSVELVSATPAMPVSLVLPKYYPPIAKVVRIEGFVTVKFDIDTSGNVENVSVEGVKTMLQGSAVEAVKQWKFPPDAYGKPGEAKLSFKLNCVPTVRTNVN